MKLVQKAILTIGMSTTIGLANAQTDTVNVTKINRSIKLESAQKVPIGKRYFGNSLDGMIFSTALIERNGANSLGTLRFTAFAHIGATINYNFSKGFGVYSGLDIKNIGLIEKFDFQNTTVKDRVYTLGIPLGLRFGNMTARNYFFMGGGVDLAFHYKHKMWSDVQSKTKFNDWFSDYTNLLLPYVFGGVAVKGLTFKVQYYPTNFFNEDKTVGTLPGGIPNKIYANTKVNLLLLSIGKDMNFSKK